MILSSMGSLAGDSVTEAIQEILTGPGEEQFAGEGLFEKYSKPILKDTGQKSLHTTGSC